jgi:hypothetical protein
MNVSEDAPMRSRSLPLAMRVGGAQAGPAGWTDINGVPIARLDVMIAGEEVIRQRQAGDSVAHQPELSGRAVIRTVAGQRGEVEALPQGTIIVHDQDGAHSCSCGDGPAACGSASSACDSSGTNTAPPDRLPVPRKTSRP